MRVDHTLWTLLAVSLMTPLCGSLAAAPPLHQQIDALIEAQEGYVPDAAAQTDDAAFLRRVYLDLGGCLPSGEALREFLGDTAENKRAQVIERLLASEQHATRMQYVLDELLMERRADKHVPAVDWQTYLRQSVLDNKPWDVLVREILSADGSEPKTRPAAKFLLDRDLRREDVTRDLGRIFLGRDLQCAQCHDHPTVDDYLQRHYFGLTAFLSRSYLFKDPKSGKTSIGEKAEGDVEFTSVFTSETDATPPRMLDLPPLDDPSPTEELYKTKPAKDARAIPTYSRRLRLAEAMIDDANGAFRRNIANRLWALMMGRGLVEPLDMMHPQNPPTHPEVLDLLAEALLDNDYDLRYLLRELALTRTYQRSSQASEGSPADTASYSVARLKPLSAEQLAIAMMQATGVVDPTAPLDEAAQKSVATFAKMFGSAGQNTRFDAAAEQVLFLRNSPLIQSWLKTEDGLVADLNALKDLKDPKDLETPELAETFYRRVYSRLPLPEESRRIAEYLNAASDRRLAIEQLTWASLVSSEFRFNH